MTTDSDGIMGLEERARSLAAGYDEPFFGDVADALRTVTAKRDEAISLSVYFRQAAEAAEARLEELTRERDDARKKVGKLHDYANMRDVQVVDLAARLEEAKAVLDASHTELSCLLANPDDFSVDKWPVENPADAACLAAAYGPMRAFLHQGGEDAR